MEDENLKVKELVQIMDSVIILSKLKKETLYQEFIENLILIVDWLIIESLLNLNVVKVIKFFIF